jgi:ferredoxin-NADP reductase
VKTIAIDVPEWPDHLAGQHLDVRLTADDGYQAQRSYSISSPPTGTPIEVTVEAVEDGEVSSYLVGEIRAADRLEVRGPIGGYFVWKPSFPGALVLVAGGSGIAPLMAMLRQRARTGHPDPALLLYSSREVDDVIFREELQRMSAADPTFRLVETLTRRWPKDWPGLSGRIDRAMLTDLGIPRLRSPNVYVCGPTGLVEATASALVDTGVEAARIRTERFGPSGG